MFSLFQRIQVTFAICIMSLGCSPVMASVTGGFATSDTSGLLYLRLTQNGHTISGYMEAVSATNDTDNGFSVRRIDNLTGSISGNLISLRVKELFGLNHPLMDGSVHGNRLIFEMPSNDGHLSQAIFVSTSAIHWNQQLRSFEVKRSVFAHKLLWHNNIISTATSIGVDYENVKRSKAQAESQLPFDKASLARAQVEQTRCIERLSKAQLAFDSARQVAKDKRAKANQTQNTDDASDAAMAEADAAFAKSDVAGVQSDLISANQDATSAATTVFDDAETISNCDGQMANDIVELQLLRQPCLMPVDSLPMKSTITSTPQLILSQPSRYGKKLYQTSADETIHCISCAEGWSLVTMSNNTLGWLAPQSVTKMLLNTERLGNSLARTAQKYITVSTKQFTVGDGSDFIRSVFSSNNIAMPGSANEQATIGYDVPRESSDVWIPGDRLYFMLDHSTIDQTGIFIGNENFIYANADGKIIVGSIIDMGFQSHLVGVRRSKELLGE